MNVEITKKTNPYIVKLSLLDKEVVLNGYSQVILIEITTFKLINSIKLELYIGNVIRTICFKIYLTVK